MGQIQVTPYLFFRGNCREAMKFYQDIFGGELTIQTYAQANITEMAGSEVPADSIMHAALQGGEIILYASDTPAASEKSAKVSISLNGTDEEKLTKIFTMLSQDVEVMYPLKKESWGDIFGSVVDKYGVEWMVDIGPAQAQ